MSSVRVNGIDYEIHFYDGNVEPTLMGREHYDKCKIYICKDLPPARKRQTLMHEILHIIYANGGLEQGDSEERIVTVLSTGITQVLEDNEFYKEIEDADAIS